MIYSLSDLATRVLKDLGIVGVDEIPTADELADAEEVIGSEVQMLGTIGVPIWNGSEMAIPQEYLTVLSRRLGLAVAPSYGLIDMATAQLAMREAERYLTVMANPNGSNPLELIANDAIPRRGNAFNFTSGL